MLIKDIEKMEAYTPTEYVNDSEPDLDADNLNKTERQLRDTVAKANEIIDTLKSLISNVSVNSEDTVPSSAVAYKMEQDIKQLNSNLIKTALVVFDVTTEASGDVALGAYSYVTYTDKSGYPVGKTILGICVEAVQERNRMSIVGIGSVNAENGYIYINSKNATTHTVKLRVYYTD